MAIPCMLGPRVASAQVPADLDAIVAAIMDAHAVPGLGLAIVHGDSTVVVRGYGLARVEDGTVVDPERTLFRLASVSKLFATLAVMQQVERGRIDLAADVDGYLEGWQVGGQDPVSTHHLLTHTAGFDERLIGYAARSSEAMTPLGRHLRTNFPPTGWRPGQHTGYSNYGMALAAYLVERVTGVDFAEYARRQVFLPLGMTRTHYRRLPDSLMMDLASGHRCGTTGCSSRPEVWSHPYPVGLAWSTPADIARFMQSALAGASGFDTPVLSSDGHRLMQAEQFSHDPSLSGMSYGFFNQRYRGQRVVSHAGNVPGINNLLLLVPEARLGLYFVTNGGGSAIGRTLRDSLLARMLPGAERPPSQRAGKPLGEAYLRTLAGPYQMTRYAHRTVERFPMLFATGATVGLDRGALTIAMDGGVIRFEPVDSLRFREVDGERMLVFRRDQRGRVGHLFTSVTVFGAEFPAAFERRAWYQTPGFMNEFVSWLAGGPILVLVGVWPVLVLVARWRGRRANRPLPGTERIGWLAGLGFQLLWLAFVFGFIARGTRMMAGATGIVFGPTPDLRALGLIPYLLVPLGGVMVWTTYRVWRRGLWDLPRRLAYAVVSGAAVLVLLFLVQWNYLPLRF